MVLKQAKWKTIRGPPIILKLSYELQSILEGLWLLSWTKGILKVITTVISKYIKPFKQSIQTILKPAKKNKKILWLVWDFFCFYQQAYPGRSKSDFYFYTPVQSVSALADSDTEITKRSFIKWRELESWYVQEAYIQALHISWTDDCSEEQSFDLSL